MEKSNRNAEKGVIPLDIPSFRPPFFFPFFLFFSFFFSLSCYLFKFLFILFYLFFLFSGAIFLSSYLSFKYLLSNVIIILQHSNH